MVKANITSRNVVHVRIEHYIKAKSAKILPMGKEEELYIVIHFTTLKVRQNMFRFLFFLLHTHFDGIAHVHEIVLKNSLTTGLYFGKNGVFTLFCPYLLQCFRTNEKHNANYASK